MLAAAVAVALVYVITARLFISITGDKYELPVAGAEVSFSSVSGLATGGAGGARHENWSEQNSSSPHERHTLQSVKYVQQWAPTFILASTPFGSGVGVGGV